MNSSPSIVLVTGAGGFVGGHVARHLAASGAYRVRALSRRTRQDVQGNPDLDWAIGDLRDPATRSRAIAGCRFVIHCASWVRLGADPKGLARSINVDVTRSLLREAKSAGVERFVYTSTLQTLAAGTPGHPADEDAEWNLLSVRSPYTESKREAEALVLAASDARMKTVALCPGMVVGPRDVGPTSTRVLLAMSRAPIVTLPGGGIPLIDARVLALAHERALTRGEPGHRYAVVGPYRSFRRQAEIVRAITGRPWRIVAVPDALLCPMASVAGWIDSAARGRWLSISRATVAGGFLRFHVDGSRGDRAFGLVHPPPEWSIFEALDFARGSGMAPWLARKPLRAVEATGRLPIPEAG